MPYTPELNGMIKRCSRSLIAACGCRHQFQSVAHPRQMLRTWLDEYNPGRPHQALGYRSSTQFRTAQVVQVTSREEPFK